jgi:hypothetical protein
LQGRVCLLPFGDGEPEEAMSASESNPSISNNQALHRCEHCGRPAYGPLPDHEACSVQAFLRYVAVNPTTLTPPDSPANQMKGKRSYE